MICRLHDLSYTDAIHMLEHMTHPSGIMRLLLINHLNCFPDSPHKEIKFGRWTCSLGYSSHATRNTCLVHLIRDGAKIINWSAIFLGEDKPEAATVNSLAMSESHKLVMAWTDENHRRKGLAASSIRHLISKSGMHDCVFKAHDPNLLKCIQKIGCRAKYSKPPRLWQRTSNGDLVCLTG